VEAKLISPSSYLKQEHPSPYSNFHSAELTQLLTYYDFSYRYRCSTLQNFVSSRAQS